MNTDTELDHALRDTFSEEDRALLEKYASEPGVYEMLAELFRGRNRWLTIVAFIYTLVFLGLAVWCAVQFFATDPAATKALIGWAAGFSVSIMVVGLIKIWFWLDMQRHAATREVKRLELAVARLAQLHIK